MPTRQWSTATLDFTDGDTLKRFTIIDADCNAASDVQCSIRTTNTADQDDQTWVYVPNVKSATAGSFDVLVAAFSGEGPAAAGEFPNEIVRLVYTLRP